MLACPAVSAVLTSAAVTPVPSITKGASTVSPATRARLSVTVNSADRFEASRSSDMTPLSVRANVTVTGSGSGGSGGSGGPTGASANTVPSPASAADSFVPASDAPEAVGLPGATVSFTPTSAADTADTATDAVPAAGPVKITDEPETDTPCGLPATASVKSVPSVPPVNASGTVTVSPASSAESSLASISAVSVLWSASWASARVASTAMLNWLSVPTGPTAAETTVPALPPPSV